MTFEEQQNLIIMGLVSKMPQEDQDKVNQCVVELRALIKKYDANGLVAFGVVGSELAAEQK